MAFVFIAPPTSSGVRPIRPMLHKFVTTSRSSSRFWPTTSCAFVGEPIAAVVAAPAAAAAEDVAEAVAVEIAELPAVVDALARRWRPGAPRVHDAIASNIVVEGRFKTADFDATLAKAHRACRRRHIRSRRQNATPLEARAPHAAFDLSSRRVTLTCATQMPHLTRTAIADVFAFPEADLRVVAPGRRRRLPGRKCRCRPKSGVSVWLAQKLRCAVAWSEDRRENLIAAFHSRDQYVAPSKAPSTSAASSFALTAEIVANIGAYRASRRHAASSR